MKAREALGIIVRLPLLFVFLVWAAAMLILGREQLVNLEEEYRIYEWDPEYC